MTSIFISYSSRDERAGAGLQAWLREHDIEPVMVSRTKQQELGDFEALKPKLGRTIDDADIVLFLVTPFWLASKMAQWELERVESENKPRLAILEAPTSLALEGSMAVVDMTRNREAGLVELKAELLKLQAFGDVKPASKVPQKEVGRGSKGAQENLLQGTIIADHQRNKRSQDEKRPLVVGLAKRQQDKANQTLKILRRGISWSALPDWLTKSFKLPVAGTRHQQKEPWFSSIKRRALNFFDIKALVKRLTSWVLGDKKRVMGAAVLLFIFATALIGSLSDRTIGGKDAVRKELANVKKRQSLFLSRVANHLRETGDEETALLLSLEALAEAQEKDDLQQARDSLYTTWIKMRKNLVFQGHDNHVSGVMFSPDGKFLLSSSWDRTARVWSLATRQQVLVLDKHDGFVNGAVYSPDQSMILTAALDNKARLFHARTGKLIRTLKGHSHDLTSATFSGDGRRIVTASGDQTARIWEVAGGQLLKTFLGHKAGLEDAVFSPDGNRIVTASADKVARILDGASGKQLALLEGHGDVVRSARFDQKGQFIATASQDKTARLWGARNGMFLRVFKGHKWAVLTASFSPDGRRLVTASKDNTARLWDVKTGEQLLVFSGHKGIVSQASFSPDGRTIVTASGDGTIRLWPLVASDRELVAKARKVVTRCLSAAQRKKYFLSEQSPKWCRQLKKQRHSRGQ